MTGRSWGPGRTVLTLLVVTLPLVPILIGLSLSSGSATAGSRASSQYRPLSSPSGSGSSTAAGGAVAATVPPGRGAIIAVLRHPTVMLRSPGGKRLGAIGLHTQFGSPQELWVAAPEARWLGVVSPLAGNGGLGWIPRSAAALARIDWELRVSLRARHLTVLEHGRAIKGYTVAIGSPSAPTPTGRFAVTDRLATGNPNGPYGCCIVALSAVAPHAIQGWTGGDRIAIHSTPETSTIGLPVSHGCLRLTLAQGRWLMNHVPLGTPTLISS